MGEEFEIVQGSGNVFADFADADASARQLKARMAAAIIATTATWLGRSARP